MGTAITLIRKAAVMINQAGFNSVKECLYFGVPMLTIPMGSDHAGTAARIKYHGLGLILKHREMSKEDVRNCIRELLSNPLFSIRARQMQEIFRAAETENKVAELVKSVIAFGTDKRTPHTSKEANSATV